MTFGAWISFLQVAITISKLASRKSPPVTEIQNDQGSLLNVKLLGHQLQAF